MTFLSRVFFCDPESTGINNKLIQTEKRRRYLLDDACHLTFFVVENIFTGYFEHCS